MTWYPGLSLDVALGALSPRSADVERLERAFAATTGRRHGVAAASARLGLRLTLQGLGLREGDEVVVPAYTEEGVPLMLDEAGLVPVFADVRDDDHTLAVDAVQAVISPRTRAIVATHLFGRPCAIEELVQLARDHGLVVLEDCAHSVLGRLGDRPLGSFGDAAVFSFGRTKPFHGFGGAMICLDDEQLAASLRRQLNAGRAKRAGSLVQSAAKLAAVHAATGPAFGWTLYPLLRAAAAASVDPASVWRATQRQPQTSYSQTPRMHPLQARVALGMLPGAEARRMARRRAGRGLLARLSAELGDRFLGDHPDHDFYFFVLRVGERRAELAERLLRRGIDTGWQVMRHCPTLFGRPDDAPRAAEAVAGSLQIPLYPSLGNRDLDRLAAALDGAWRS